MNILNRMIRFINGHFTEELLVQVVISLSVLIIILISFILIFLFRKTKRLQRKNFLQKMFNSLLGEIAICESEEELNIVFMQEDHQKLLHQFGRSAFDRNILIGELAETSKKFRGSAMTNIQWLFKKMNLENELLTNLHHKQWHKKSKAVQQLSYLRQKDQVVQIVPFTNHPNVLLRTEAQIAIVKMTGFSGLDFLNSASYPISEWQQLRLIHELSGKPFEDLNKVDNWLISTNISVVNFALRLVEIYRQYQFYSTVKKCLAHSSTTISTRAVCTLSQISNDNTMKELITFFPVACISAQLEIIIILQNQGTMQELPFLFSVTDHPDNTFKLEAAKAILNISPEAFEEIASRTNTGDYPWNVIFPQLKLLRA